MNAILNSTYICASGMWGVGVVSEHMCAQVHMSMVCMWKSEDSLRVSIPFSQLVLGIRSGTKCYHLTDHCTSPFKPKPRYLVCKI